MLNITIPSSILEELNKIKNAEAFLLSGSKVLGKSTKNSDWDIFVILKDGQKRWRKTSKVQGEWLELMCNDKSQIMKEFKEDLEEGRGVTVYMFTTGQIIKDNKSKVLHKLTAQAQKLWRKGPKPLSKQQLSWISYDIATYMQDLEDCIVDDKESTLLSNYAINEFVRYYYRLSNKWQPRPKDRLNDFAKQAKSLYKFVREYNQSADWKQKAKLAIKLGQSLAKQFKLDISGELYVPPTTK